MKYTICGFQQDKLIKYDFDDRDAQIIRYVLDFYQSGKMKKEVFNGQEYFWINYGNIQKEFPIFRYKERKTIERRFKKYISCKLFYHETLKRGGVFSYFRFNDDILNDLLQRNVSEDSESPKDGISKSQCIGFERPYKDSSTNYYTTKDSIVESTAEIIPLSPFHSRASLHNKIKQNFIEANPEYYHDGKEAKAIDELIKRGFDRVMDKSDFEAAYKVIQEKAYTFYKVLKHPHCDYYAKMTFIPSKLLHEWNNIKPGMEDAIKQNQFEQSFTPEVLKKLMAVKI